MTSSPIAIADNCWTKAEQAMAEALANSASFRLMAGVDDYEEALNGRIFPDEFELPAFGDEYTDEELDSRGLGFAIVSSTSGQPYRKTRSNKNANRWIPGGALVIELFRFLFAHDGESELYLAGMGRDMKNRAGKMIDELIVHFREALDTPVYVRSYEVIEGPVRTDEFDAPSAGDWQSVAIVAQWAGVD